MSSEKLPQALFDQMEFVHEQSAQRHTGLPTHFQDDFQQALVFLQSYKGSVATFNAYRREVERLLQWSWLIANKSLRELKRTDIENYLAFCQNPPKTWIALKKPPRFIEKNGTRIPNSEWRPFVATISKAQFKLGVQPNTENYEPSQASVKEIFAILSSFYNFLIGEDYTQNNPIAQIRQKSQFLRKTQSKPKIRRLSELQWAYVIETAEKMAEANPDQHERTLFMMSILFGMYLRISELAASTRWTPKMGDFFRDHDGLWWFTTVGKGNKERQISVSDAVLEALKRYRQFLNLTALPAPGETTALFPKLRGKGPVTSTTYIRKVVQNCFDRAIASLKQDGFHDDASSLEAATVHWLRHTGISEDVKTRPREHVRDDAGHSSSAITDKYIDIELRARHASAKKKLIKSL